MIEVYRAMAGVANQPEFAKALVSGSTPVGQPAHLLANFSLSHASFS